MRRAIRLTFLLLSLSSTPLCFGQTRVDTAESENIVAHNSKRIYNEDEVSQKPEFVGGQMAMYAYLSKYIKYTREATRANVTGKLFTRFVVNADGSISDISMLKGMGFGMDEMLISVISKMPRWRPGKLAVKPVPVVYNLPVTICGPD